MGRRSRTVPPGLRTALAHRDGGCAFPGCGRPPDWCDAHHVRHWRDGGSTSRDNLALLCGQHHQAVHEGGWHLTLTPDGRPSVTPPGSAPLEDAPTSHNSPGHDPPENQQAA